MRNYYFILLSLLFFTISCGGSNDDITDPSPSSEQQIVLDNLTFINDNAVKLKWSATSKNTYVLFEVLRKYTQIGQYKKIYEIATSEKNTEITDLNISYTPYVEYQIVGYLNNGDIVKSKPVKYQRPEEINLLDIRPTDALFDSDTGNIFIIGENGNILKYNVNTKQKVEISTGATLGNSYLGNYNGQKELYVPRNDGWVYIYNPDNLTLKDKINFGNSVTSVILKDDKLYGSTEMPSKIKSFNRMSKLLISESSTEGPGILKLIPNTYSFYYLIKNTYPEKFGSINFQSNGEVANLNWPISANHPLNYRIAEVLPTGELVSSMYGIIYNKNLTYKSYLQLDNSNLSTYDFDSNYIIAGANNNRKIEFYKLIDYTKVNNSLSTKGYPFKVFNYGNKVVSISSINILSIASAHSGPSPENIIVEILNK